MISSLELAKICGVSQGTVDRAIHDRPGINPETKKRILEAADKHGYHPHPAMHEMLSGKTSMIGAVIPQTTHGVFYTDLLEAIRNAFHGAGLRVYSTTANDENEFIEVLTDMAARRMRAAVAVTPCEDVTLPKKVTRNMPVATLLNPCAGDKTEFFSPDEIAVGEQVTQKLIDYGHEKITHYTYRQNIGNLRLRRMGFENVMSKNGLEPDITTPSYQDVFIKYVKEEKPTAIFAHNDFLAFQAIGLLQQEGLRVPEDISVVGIGNGPTFLSFNSTLSTFAYPMQEIAEDTLAWVEKKKKPKAISALEFIERDTLRKI